LYPQLDLWKTAKPFLEQWVKDQVGPKRFFDTLKQHGPSWIAKAPQMPDLIHNALAQAHQGSRSDQQIVKQLEAITQQVAVHNKKQRRRGLAVVVVGASLAIPSLSAWLPSIGHGQWLGIMIGLLLFLWP
jgi:ubiquinone biosynthesis protein